MIIDTVTLFPCPECEGKTTQTVGEREISASSERWKNESH